MQILTHGASTARVRRTMHQMMGTRGRAMEETDTAPSPDKREDLTSIPPNIKRFGTYSDATGTGPNF